jgi:hypothetical protein
MDKKYIPWILVVILTFLLALSYTGNAVVITVDDGDDLAEATEEITDDAADEEEVEVGDSKEIVELSDDADVVVELTDPDFYQLADYVTSTTGAYGTDNYTYTTEEWWGRLIRTNDETTENEIIYENPNDLGIPYLKIIAQPEGSDFIYMQAYLPDTDAGGGYYYAFDTNSGSILTMQFNALKLDPWFFGVQQVSSDETQLIGVSNSLDSCGDVRELYLIELASDTYREVVTLPEGETLNGGTGALSNYFDIDWMSGNRISYAVFDQSKKTTEAGDCRNNFLDDPSLLIDHLTANL